MWTHSSVSETETETAFACRDGMAESLQTAGRKGKGRQGRIGNLDSLG